METKKIDIQVDNFDSEWDLCQEIVRFFTELYNIFNLRNVDELKELAKDAYSNMETSEDNGYAVYCLDSYHKNYFLVLRDIARIKTDENYKISIQDYDFEYVFYNVIEIVNYLKGKHYFLPNDTPIESNDDLQKYFVEEIDWKVFFRKKQLLKQAEYLNRVNSALKQEISKLADEFDNIQICDDNRVQYYQLDDLPF